MERLNSYKKNKHEIDISKKSRPKVFEILTNLGRQGYEFMFVNQDEHDVVGAYSYVIAEDSCVVINGESVVEKICYLEK